MSNNSGIYVGLVNFTAALLAIHMKVSQVLKGISKTIQNELLEVQSIPGFDNKVIDVFLSKKAREWILYTKHRGNFFCAHPHSEATISHCWCQTSNVKSKPT
nr:unnamed protein product [Callosobruchus analis]